MFLNRLTLHGFKSFADRIEFEFGAGMTGIVGPNGCGKSNVLDAMRWVLGEQSARSLRGQKMQDVIFAGSRSRKPANFAEVTLHFDNSRGLLPRDESEVSVGRVLYRSGDSEYKINNQIVRRRDVRDLLLDTGVGVDAYSVIEQGRVDALLQADPIQRREIFEEAAGISRYKVRRAEAQRKLERTQNNLLRLDDVVEELERRLRSVKVAAGKARNFKEYDTRLRELRSSFSLAEYDRLSKLLRSAGFREQALSDIRTAKRVDIARREAHTAELEHELQSLDESIQEAETHLRGLQSESGALAERIAQGERRVSDLTGTLERQTTQTSESERQTREIAARIGQEEGGLAELRGAEQREADRIEALRQQRQTLEAETRAQRQAVEQQKTAVFEAARQIALLQNEASNLEEQLARAQRDAQRRRARLEAVAEERAEAQARRDGISRSLTELDAQIQRDRDGIERLDTQLAEARTEQARLDEELDAQKQRRSSLASRLDLLRDMDRRYEGVGAGARWLLETREAGGGEVVGLVAELLHIHESRVEVLQPLLSSFENRVVVRSLHAFLADLGGRDQPPGTLDVLALDRFAATDRATEFDGAPGVLGLALDAVSCDEAYTGLAATLLGGVVLVDSLERALALSEGARPGRVFVTPEGHVVQPGGVLRMRGAHEPAGLFSRKAEIRHIEQELDGVETALERASRERNAIAASAADLQLQREGRQEELARSEKQRAEVAAQGVRLDDELGRFDRERESIENELAGIDRSLAEMRERQGALEQERAGADEARQQAETGIERLEASQQALSERVTSLDQELTEAQIDVGRTRERRIGKEATLADLRNQLAARQQEHARSESEAESAARAITEAKAELGRARERKQELGYACEGAERTVAGLRGQRQGLRRRLEANHAALRLLHAEADEAERALHDCEVTRREVEVRRETLVARVADELELDLETLHADYQPEARDWDAVRAEIEELRGKIARLGNVNLDALDELEELTPRYENLSSQRADLIESVQRLETLISELDSESRTRFEACFGEVRQNFQELFRKLFGGGKADMVLEDPERPLECGIEIIARPPGKEPQSISLLSGGEKTLAAVAILFAVFKRKPSPFAILDEVDAALDESNIDRFNTMLSEFMEHSQFVVITHSKQTMQCADVLYGVTMEEPGVSKRVSVRFDRVETPNVA